MRAGEKIIDAKEKGMDGKAKFSAGIRKIVEDSNSPLYLQLKNIIKAQIISGAIQPGDKIPSESELSKIR